MSKRAFYIYLAFLAGLVLFSLSPVAALGGLVVAFLIFVPMMFLLASLGVDVSGQTIDGLTAAIFFGVSAFLVMIAVWLFYRGADLADRGMRDQARGRIASGLTLIAFPVAIYFCFKALPLN